MLTRHHPNCPKYEKRTIKVWTVYPGRGLNPCTEKDPQAVLSWIEEAEPGETIEIKVREMDAAVFAELPEYEGP